MNFPLISQNPIDGRWEARFDGLEIASRDYFKVEAAIDELVNWRAQQETLEHMHDEWEEQHQDKSPWGNAENAVACLGALTLIVVIAASFKVAPIIWAWVFGG